ncbi:MAG: electron transfer flavoprotein subunit alpha/FixB family protein [Chloroflexota bacterium]
MSGVLVFVEHAGGEIERVSREALTLGASLAAATGGPLEAMLIGPGADRTAAALGSGVSTAHVVSDDRLHAYAPAAWAGAIVQLIETRPPAAVLAGGSDRGNEVLAHVAARTARPMAANVVSVSVGDPWRLTRQRWAGSLLEDATLDADVRLLTVAPHVVPVPEPEVDAAGSTRPTIAQSQPAVHEPDLVARVIGHEAPEAGTISLTDARVVVGGGRGVGSGEGFATLEELAGLLGGAVGGSRVVTSAGWRPHSDQIGQTGLRIAPELYVACGISGAIQHIVGCKAAKRILAINTDPDAPIMGVADYAVIGDLHQVVPAISAEIRRRAASRG